MKHIWFVYFVIFFFGTFLELFLLLKLINRQPKKFQQKCPEKTKKKYRNNLKLKN